MEERTEGKKKLGKRERIFQRHDHFELSFFRSCFVFTICCEMQCILTVNGFVASFLFQCDGLWSNSIVQTFLVEIE